MVRSDFYDDSELQRYRFPEDLTVVESNSSAISPFLFLCIVLCLVGFGLVTLYSASYDEALRNGLAPSYYVVRQLVFAMMGFAAFAVLRIVPLSWIRKAIPLFLLLSLALMVLTLATPLGVVRLGARRWLQIGPLPSFQPSELLKVSVVLYLAHLFAGEQEPAVRFRRILVAIVIVLLSAILILLQRDYSTTLVFLLVSLAMFLVGGLHLRYIALFSFGILVPALIFLLTEPYRIKRVVSFLFPSIDPTGLNWQVRNSLAAIASGRLLGKGIGNGIYKLGIIPEVQSDFIFASLAEETGFVGVLFFFLLFAAFALLGFGTAWKHVGTESRFASSASFGITFMILCQALVNLAVVTSLLPPTGIPLPFFSQGGTNLFMILAECGLLYRFMISSSQEVRADG